MAQNALPWNMTAIEQLGRIVTGKTPPTKQTEYYGDEYPFITPTDIHDNSRTAEPERFLSEEGKQYLKNRLLPPGSTCFVCIGSIGKICITTTPSFTNQQINTVIADQAYHDPMFVYYLLRYSARRIKALAGGVATPIISKSAFSRTQMAVPPLTAQRIIAAVLSTYDDLIDNNARRIKVLEEMAQMIYREWFVNFRFPGHEKVEMVQSKQGMLPERWEVKTVSCFGNVVTGKTPSKDVPEYFGGHVPFIKIPDMHGNMFCIDTTDKLSELGANSQRAKTIPANSLCVSCIGTAGLAVITTMPSQTNQQINSVVPRDENEREYLFFVLRGLKQTINQFGAIGATMANLSKRKFEALPVLSAGRETIAEFHKLVFPVFEQIKSLQSKNAILRQTRDLLLPMLISGEVDVENLDIDTRGLGNG